MPRFKGSPKFAHDGAERIGVLLVNSGTPDSPRTSDIRRFLAGLLGDRRVVEVPRAIWLPILHGIILRTRPYRTARKYRKIWSDAGSPMRRISDALAANVRARLARRVLAPVSIELGMLYSSPSVASGLERLAAQGAQRLLVLPLFPQYCGVTTGAVHDQVARELSRWRWLPEQRFVNEYHDHPEYIDAWRERIAAHWQGHGRTRHLLLSFHGIPQAYFRRGDPYFCKCQKTARLLADALQLEDEQWSLCFQSRYGPGNWLQPYTDTVLGELPRRGVRSVTVACPGFAVDCLESLEEIALDGRERFISAGGTEFQYVPALNDTDRHAALLAGLIETHCGGWVSNAGLRAGNAVREPGTT
ncbi:MAG: ferrochelatase [Steroidobacteraceae bacterium]